MRTGSEQNRAVFVLEPSKRFSFKWLRGYPIRVARGSRWHGSDGSLRSRKLVRTLRFVSRAGRSAPCGVCCMQGGKPGRGRASRGKAARARQRVPGGLGLDQRMSRRPTDREEQGMSSRFEPGQVSPLVLTGVGKDVVGNKAWPRNCEHARGRFGGRDTERVCGT